MGCFFLLSFSWGRVCFCFCFELGLLNEVILIVSNFYNYVFLNFDVIFQLGSGFVAPFGLELE